MDVINFIVGLARLAHNKAGEGRLNLSSRDVGSHHQPVVLRDAGR